MIEPIILQLIFSLRSQLNIEKARLSELEGFDTPYWYYNSTTAVITELERQINELEKISDLKDIFKVFT